MIIHSKISATKNRQDAEVNITSCNGISFIVPWPSNKTNTKDDTYQIRKRQAGRINEIFKIIIVFLCFLKPVFRAHPKVDM